MFAYILLALVALFGIRIVYNNRKSIASNVRLMRLRRCKNGAAAIEKHIEDASRTIELAGYDEEIWAWYNDYVTRVEEGWLQTKRQELLKKWSTKLRVLEILKKGAA